MKIFIILLLICLCFQVVTSAETIVLKSGKTIEGKIIEKTDKYIKIDFHGVLLTYFLDEIVSGEEKSYPERESEDIAKSAVSKEYNDYHISDFEIMILYPSDWHLLDTSEILQKQEPGKKVFGLVLTKDIYGGIDKDLPLPYILLTGYKTLMPNLSISTETMANAVISELKDRSSGKILEGAERFKINDREWVKINFMEDDFVRTMKCIYADESKCIVYVYQLTSKLEDFNLHEQVFLDILENIKF